METNSQVTIGIVGLGGMGTRHAHNFSELGADIIAGSDVASAARNSFETEFDASTYEEFATMYAEAEPDAIVITTPNKFHEPAATAALERDIHVLCEKPLADSVAAAEKILEADAASDAFCMVGFSNRFSPATSLFKAYQEDDEFGGIDAIEGRFVRRRGIPGLGSWFTDKELSGGGALIDIGVHAIDYGLYLAGYPEVIEVTGVTRDTFISENEYVDPDNFASKWHASAGNANVDDSVTALLRCANDTTISLEIAWATNRDPSKEFVVRGSKSGARLAIGGEDLTIYRTDDRAADHYSDTELSRQFESTVYREEAKTFLDGIKSDSRPHINHISEGYQVQRVIEAIYESSERGTAVRLDSASAKPEQRSPAAGDD